jgi:hydroxyacylglutathione hydrolase
MSKITQILSQPMGEYQTNCYVVLVGDKSIIIDPGIGALEWLKSNAKNPVGILNTHGHFDHVWSNSAVQKYFDIPIYTPKDDTFLIEEDLFGRGLPPSKADIEVEPNEEFEIAGVKVKFHFFPGHTPGCSAIEIEDNIFSGDFVFKRSIGRTDFPYSNSEDMKDSLLRFEKFEKDYTIFPGHGDSTTFSAEKSSLRSWISYL